MHNQTCYDPVVQAHTRALLLTAAPGATSYVDADAREPKKIIQAAEALIDFGSPVAIILIDLLNFIEDDTVAASIMAELIASVCAGSYVAILHPASDLDSAMLEAERLWNQVSVQRTRLRPRQQVADYLAGLELVEPGLVTVGEWRPEQPMPPVPLYGAVARKPA